MCTTWIKMCAWNSIGEVSKPQRFSQVAVLAQDQVVLVFGRMMDAFVDTVVIGTIDKSQDSECYSRQILYGAIFPIQCIFCTT